MNGTILGGALLACGLDREDLDRDLFESPREPAKHGGDAEARRCSCGRCARNACERGALSANRGADGDIAAGVVAAGAEQHERPLGRAVALRGGVDEERLQLGWVRCDHGPISFSCCTHGVIAMHAAGPQHAFPPRRRTNEALGVCRAPPLVHGALATRHFAARPGISGVGISTRRIRAQTNLIRAAPCRRARSRRAGRAFHEQSGSACLCDDRVGGLFGHASDFGKRLSTAPDFVRWMFAQTKPVRKGSGRAFAEVGRHLTRSPVFPVP